MNLLILLVTVAAGGFMIWFGWVYLRAGAFLKQIDQQITLNGINADAEIVNHRYSIGSEGISYYYITYQYTVKMLDGQMQKLTSEDTVSHADYSRLKLGDHITIRYLPSDPKTARPGSEIREIFSSKLMRRGGWIVIALGIGIIVFGVVIVGWSTVRDTQTATTATAETIRLSATPNPAQISATQQAATATSRADQINVNQIRDHVQSRLADWKRVNDRVIHRVLPPETDLGLNEIEIDYGYCINGSFYMYAWIQITDRLKLDTETDTFLNGYGYVEGSTPTDCYPKDLSQVWLRDNGLLGTNWYAVSGATEVKAQKQG